MALTAKRIVKISKFLSLVLRHKPEIIDLRLDAAGWARVDELLAAVNQAGVPLTQEILKQTVRENDKNRFALSDDGRRIRANYGHSIPVDLGLMPRVPPESLFHGTATRSLGSIMAHGITRGRRRYVHLSIDEPTATQVGGRHGKPIVLRVQALHMHRDGFVFYRSESSIWLTEHVPAQYIEFPAS
jgi:putative RNA 2'-phosphotransferase